MHRDAERLAVPSLYDDRVVEEIVTKTASELDCDPIDLAPLGAVIDPEVVDGFADSDAITAESELHFRYNDCEICVDGTGDVRVEPVSD